MSCLLPHTVPFGDRNPANVRQSGSISPLHSAPHMVTPGEDECDVAVAHRVHERTTKALLLKHFLMCIHLVSHNVR